MGNNSYEKLPPISLIKNISSFSIPLLIVLSLLTYIPTLYYDYVFCDDTDIIIRDYERINDISRIPDEFIKGYINTDYYRPLQNISYIVNTQITGKTPFSYKIFNLSNHILFVIVLYLFLIHFGLNKITALVLSSIFAIHPLFINAVVWIPGRNDLMFSLFGLLSFLLLIKYISSPKGILLTLHILSFWLAILSKETALMIPFIMLLYLILIKREKLLSKLVLKHILLWLIPILLWLILRTIADLGKPAYFTSLDIMLYNIPSIFEYIGKFFFPIKLSTLPTYSLLNTFLGVIAFSIIIFLIIKFRNGDVK